MSPDQRASVVNDRDPSAVLAALGVTDSATPPAPPDSGEVGLDDIGADDHTTDISGETISEVQNIPSSPEDMAAAPKVIGEGTERQSSADMAITPELHRTQVAGEVLAKCKAGDLEGAIGLLTQIDNPAIIAILQEHLEATAKLWAERLVQDPSVETDRPMAIAVFEQARVQAEVITVPELRSMIMRTIDQSEASFILESKLSPEEKAICGTRIRDPQISSDVILQSLYDALHDCAKKCQGISPYPYEQANQQARAITAKYVSLMPIKSEIQHNIANAFVNPWTNLPYQLRARYFDDFKNRKPISTYGFHSDIYVRRQP